MAAQLLDFPVELLINIVSQVDCRSDLLNLQLTCGIFYKLANQQLWRVLDLGTPAAIINSLQEMLMKPGRRFHVREVRLTQIPDPEEVLKVPGIILSRHRMIPIPGLEGSTILRFCRVAQLCITTYLLQAYRTPIRNDTVALLLYELNWVFLETLLAAIILLSPHLRTITVDVPVAQYYRWIFAPGKILATVNDMFHAALQNPVCPVLPSIKTLRVRPGMLLGNAWSSLDAFYTLQRVKSIKRIDLIHTDSTWDFRHLDRPLYLPDLEDIRLDRGVHSAARLYARDRCIRGKCIRVPGRYTDLADAYAYRETLDSFLQNRSHRLKRLHYFISAEALAPIRTCGIAPIIHLSCLSKLQRLTHLETDTSALYGHIAHVFRFSLGAMLPPNLRFLRLVEDWTLQRSLEDDEIPAYRRTMYGRLVALVTGCSAIPTIETVVFQPHLGVYWEDLSGPAEWRRGPNARDPFGCLREAVEADEWMAAQPREVMEVDDDSGSDDEGKEDGSWDYEDDEEWQWAEVEGEGEQEEDNG